MNYCTILRIHHGQKGLPHGRQYRHLVTWFPLKLPLAPFSSISTTPRAFNQSRISSDLLKLAVFLASFRSSIKLSISSSDGAPGGLSPLGGSGRSTDMLGEAG